jgi:hypothetical protein
MSNAEVILYIYNDMKQLAKRLYWRFAIRFYPQRMQNYFNYISKQERYNRDK